MRYRLLALPALVIVACASPPDAGGHDDAAAPELAEGRFLAEVHCAACHAIDRNDSSQHADAPALRTLSRNYPVSALEESLAEGIMVGHPDMPEYRFRPEDIAALIGWLEHIQDD